MQLGERLEYLRNIKGVSQKDLCDELDVIPSTWNKWEKNKTRPDYETLAKIVQYFGTTSDYLLGLDDAPTRERSDALSRIGLKPEVIQRLEKFVNHGGSHPIYRVINDLVLDGNVLDWIAVALYYTGKIMDDDSFNTIKNAAGEPVSMVDLDYLDDDVSIAFTACLSAREVVSMKILDAIRDLSQKIKAQQQ